jgi:hypothetical protein
MLFQKSGHKNIIQHARSMQQHEKSTTGADYPQCALHTGAVCSN